MDHAALHGVQGLVTLVGIRFTTARGDAAAALDLLLRQMAFAPARADTDAAGARRRRTREFRGIPQPRTPPGLARGGRQARWIGSCVRMARSILKSSPLRGRERRGSSGAAQDTATLLAEATFAVQSEMAVRLEDVVLRRTEMGSGMPSGPGGAGGGGGAHARTAGLERRARAGRARGDESTCWRATGRRARRRTSRDEAAAHGRNRLHRLAARARGAPARRWTSS